MHPNEDYTILKHLKKSPIRGLCGSRVVRMSGQLGCERGPSLSRFYFTAVHDAAPAAAADDDAKLNYFLSIYPKLSPQSLDKTRG